MLAAAVRRVHDAGWRASNVDVTVVTQLPKIGPHREAMRTRLAGVLGVPAQDVFVKGKTNEGMGWIGRGEGLAVIAVATLVRADRTDRGARHATHGWSGSPRCPRRCCTWRILVAAFAENVFPPLPADTVVALGAFVAARGNGSALGAWTATMIGNIGGAMTMFALGTRHGNSRAHAAVSPVVPGRGVGARGPALSRTGDRRRSSISRFLPGLRALVPPVAGAIGMAPLRAASAMAIASGVWYGVICWLAFSAGANAEVAAGADCRPAAGLLAPSQRCDRGGRSSPRWCWRRRTPRHERRRRAVQGEARTRRCAFHAAHLRGCAHARGRRLAAHARCLPARRHPLRRLHARSAASRACAGITPAALREFVYHLKDLGLAGSSIRRNISALRTWFRILLAEGVVHARSHRAAGCAAALAHAARGAHGRRGHATARRAGPRRAARLSRSRDAGAGLWRRPARVRMDRRSR